LLCGRSRKRRNDCCTSRKKLLEKHLKVFQEYLVLNPPNYPDRWKQVRNHVSIGVLTGMLYLVDIPSTNLKKRRRKEPNQLS
jgi:hypothetical protein